jgi:hypothetical protein
MDIFDQVVKLLKDIEIKEKKSKTEYQSVRVLLLVNLFRQYDQYVTKKQWKSAHDCLVDIIALFTAMLVRSGGPSSQ